MARPLLVPVAFTTLLGLGLIEPAVASPPAPAPTTAPTTAPAAPVLPTAPQAETPDLVTAVVVTARSGNARAPSYDDACMMTKLGCTVRTDGPR